MSGSADIVAIIERIIREQGPQGIELKVAGVHDIQHFESVTGLKLPDEMRTFYSLYSELEGAPDIFRIIPLAEVIEKELFSENKFEFAEYLIYSDTWSVKINENDCNDYVINTTPPTQSFAEFLERYLDDGVYQGFYR
jgi:hypothetical protein